MWKTFENAPHPLFVQNFTSWLAGSPDLQILLVIMEKLWANWYFINYGFVLYKDKPIKWHGFARKSNPGTWLQLAWSVLWIQVTEGKLLHLNTATVSHIGSISQAEKLPKKKYVALCFPCSPHTRPTQFQESLFLHPAGLCSFLHHNSEMTIATVMKNLTLTFNNYISSPGFIWFVLYGSNLLTQPF